MRNPPPEPAAGGKGGWRQRLRREFISYWITVLYLALYFGAFTLYRRLILAHHQIAYLNYGFAGLQALVLAKVVLVGDLMRLGRGLEHRPLIWPVLFRAVLFTLWVAVFKLFEFTVRGLVQGEGLAAGVEELLSKGKYELLASSLLVFFTFIPFFAFRELNRVLGPGRMWGLFFRRGPPAAGGAEPPPQEQTK